MNYKYPWCENLGRYDSAIVYFFSFTMPIDYKKYPKDWKEIRARILLRSNNTCEFCGVVNYSTVNRNGKEVRIILTIAHLDHDEENHNVADDRLKSLCQKCHLQYDIEEKKRRKNTLLFKS